MNGYTPVKVLLNTVLFVSIITAREVTLTGTITDTVLIPGIDENSAAVSVGPAAGQNVSAIILNCGNNPDTYFGTTDSCGTYHIIVNLPDSCTSDKFDIRTSTTLPDSSYYVCQVMMPINDTVREITLSQLHSPTYDVDSVVDGEFVHMLMFQVERFRKEGDSLLFQYSFQKLVQNDNRVRFNNCGYHMEIRTTRGDIVLDSTISCSVTNEGIWMIPQDKGWCLTEYMAIHLPCELSEHFPAFAQDRKLIVSFSLNERDVEVNAVLTVLPVNLSDMTSTGSASCLRKKAGTTTPVTLTLIGSRLSINTSVSASYSMDLFLPDGRLISRVLDNVPLQAGRHTLSLHPDNRYCARTAAIARIRSSRATQTFRILW